MRRWAVGNLVLAVCSLEEGGILSDFVQTLWGVFVVF